MNDKFWLNIDKTTTCWISNHYIATGGYTQFYDRETRKMITCHRYVWEITNGPIPKKHVIRQTCENRRCVNPDHLYMTTYKEKTRDMFLAGKSNHHLSREISEQVLALREQGDTYRKIGSKLGISHQSVMNIVHNSAMIDNTLRP